MASHGRAAVLEFVEFRNGTQLTQQAARQFRGILATREVVFVSECFTET